jgi:hypothetical protein
MTTALSEAIKAAQEAGNPVVTMRLNLAAEGQAPSIDLVTEAGLNKAPSKGEFQEAVAGVLDVDVQTTTAHLHGEMLAAPVNVNSQITPDKIAQLEQNYANSPSMAEVTPTNLPAMQAPIQSVEIKPDEVNADTIKQLQYMAEEGMFGANGKESLANALNELYVLRPDLAQEMGRIQPQQQQTQPEQTPSAQVNKSASINEGFGQDAGNWMERIAQQNADKGAQISR